MRSLDKRVELLRAIGHHGKDQYTRLIGIKDIKKASER